MAILLVRHEDCARHVASPGHPERPERLVAVQTGLEDAGLLEAVRELRPREATDEELAAVHDAALLELIDEIAARGGGRIDADTGMNADSRHAARLAAGAGLAALEALGESDETMALCAVRPPGHHATRSTSMGFCIYNSIAVTARSLTAKGRRVAIIDVDAHHGNGTQDVFYDDPSVWFGSIHQWPCYPGTGRVEEVGDGAGLGTTVNVPVPPGATGDVYLAAIDTVFAPAIDAFEPDCLLISAGFDSHRDDPLTQLGLTSGDHAAIVRRLIDLVPVPPVALLEGGYDLRALANAIGAVAATALDVQYQPERVTNGGPGREIVEAAAAHQLTLR